MRFEFITGRPALDFLPTLAERGTGEDEKLRTERDLAEWIVESGIVDEAPDLEPGHDLARARELREALFRLVAGLIDGRPVDRGDCALVNAVAEAPTPVPRLDRGRLHRAGDLDAVLAVLARDGLDLHDFPDRSLLRWCADSRCTRPFVDRSRGRRRRWCGMKGCGDRAKAAAYRERRRSGST